MKGEHFDLVTRLREGRTNGTSLRWSVTDVHQEAADRIEALEAWLAEAMEVLRPFAEVADMMSSKWEDYETHWPLCITDAISVGHLRAARRLVEKEDGRHG